MTQIEENRPNKTLFDELIVEINDCQRQGYYNDQVSKYFGSMIIAFYWDVFLSRHHLKFASKMLTNVKAIMLSTINQPKILALW